MTTASPAERAGRQRGPDSIVKNAMSTFAAQMTTATLTALLTLFLVRGLGAKQYGLFALTIGMSSIAVALADLGISDSTARFVAESRGRAEAELGGLVADALKLKIVATGLLCALFAAFAPLIAHLYGNSALTWPIRGIALATFGQSTYAMALGVSTAMGRSAVNVRLVATESVIEVAASVALVLAGAGAAGAAFGRATGFVSGAIIAAGVVLRLSGRGTVSFWRPPRRATIRLVSGYAGPVFAIDASYTLSSSLSVLLLGAYVGSAASGVFQAPAKLIVLIQYVGLSTSYGVAPRLARGQGQEPNVKALNGALRGLIGFQCLVLAPAVIWAHPITRLLLGTGYSDSAKVLAALAPYIFFSGLAPLVTSGVSYTGEAKRRVPIALATLVLVAVSGVVLIPSHGVVGAAIATDIAFGFYTLAHIWLCRRLLELRLGVLAWSLASGLTAAAAMGIVLEFVGTTDLTLGDWLVGGTGGILAYVAMLMFTNEIRGKDIVRGYATVGAVRARRKLTAASTPTPDVVPDPLGPAEIVEPSQPRQDAGRDRGDHAAGIPIAADAPVPRRSGPGLLRSVRARWTTGRTPAARVRVAFRSEDAARRSPAAQPPAWLQEGFWPRQAEQPGLRVGSEGKEDLPQGSPPGPTGVARAEGEGKTKPPAPAVAPPASASGPKRAPRARAGPDSREQAAPPATDAPAPPATDAPAPPATDAPAPPATDAPVPPLGAQAVSPTRADVVYQIVWRLVDDESGVFEVRPVDSENAEAHGPSVFERSSAVRWGWPMPPAPTPEARSAHAVLVERLLAAHWRRAGSGDAWFAHCFQAPDPPSKADAQPSTGRRGSPEDGT